MGGDGGVIASNRKYMRHAGSANKTGNEVQHSHDTTHAEQEHRQQQWTKCAVSGRNLFPPSLMTSATTKEAFHEQLPPMVACPFGRFYIKEAVVEALLDRKQQPNVIKNEISHIRGLKDLYPVRFYFQAVLTDKSKTVWTPTCPVTHVELIPSASLLASTAEGTVKLGQSSVWLLHPGNINDQFAPNVLSERALTMSQHGTTSDFQCILPQQLPDMILEEYGPVQQLIRLAPPQSLLPEIQEKWRHQQQEEEADKKKKKSGKHERADENRQVVYDNDQPKRKKPDEP
jgi:Rtf2 RING-finger